MRKVTFQRYRFDSHRAGRPSRVLVDLFGPLIDISVLDFLSGVPDVRSATLEEIVSYLNQGGRDRPWDVDKLVGRLISVLENWDYYDDRLLNIPALETLARALDRGTEVCVVTETPSAQLASKAYTVVCDAMTRIRNGKKLPDCLTFKHLADSETWTTALEELGRKEEKYTYVIHDNHPSDVLNGIPDPASKQSLYDEWFGSPDPEILDNLIRDALDREKRFSPLSWLADRTNLRISDFAVFGDYLIYDESLRASVMQQAQSIKRRATEGAPAVVVLGGPSGSGKSFFAEQYIEAFGHELAGDDHDTEIARWDLSGVLDLQRSLAEFLHDICARRSAFVLLDEVDTIVGGQAAFRFLMRPMSGKLPADSGRGVGIPLPVKVWFMAGSVGSSRKDWIKALSDVDRKIVDWTNRVFQWVELPEVKSFEAMLQAANVLVPTSGDAVSIRRSVLAYFGLAEWRDVRHVRAVAQEVAKDSPRGPIHAAQLRQVIHHDTDNIQLLENIRQQLTDNLVRVQR